MNRDQQREHVAAALRRAACTGDCGDSEADCAQKRIQPCVWHFGVLAEILGTPEVIAEVAITALLNRDDTDLTEGDSPCEEN